MFVALFAAFLTAMWVSAVIWAFRDIRARSRDIFAQILATLLVFIFFPLFPVPGLILYWILRPRETLDEIYERSLEEEALLQGIEERLACPTCNRRIDEDYVICPSCHTRLKKPCHACGRLLHLSWSICAYCGADQTAARAVPSLQIEPAPVSSEPGGQARMLSAASPTSLPEPDLAYDLEADDRPDAEAEADYEAEDEVEPAPDSEADPDAETQIITPEAD
jgi:RNA polymerase subunit RPABC4/transcription elongation factor Spt4